MNFRRTTLAETGIGWVPAIAFGAVSAYYALNANDVSTAADRSKIAAVVVKIKYSLYVKVSPQ